MEKERKTAKEEGYPEGWFYEWELENVEIIDDDNFPLTNNSNSYIM